MCKWGCSWVQIGKKFNFFKFRTGRRVSLVDPNGILVNILVLGPVSLLTGPVVPTTCLLPLEPFLNRINRVFMRTDLGGIFVIF